MVQTLRRGNAETGAQATRQGTQRVETVRVSYRDRVIPAAFGLDERKQLKHRLLDDAVEFTFQDQFPPNASPDDIEFFFEQFTPLYLTYIEELVEAMGVMETCLGGATPAQAERAQQVRRYLTEQGYSSSVRSAEVLAIGTRKRNVDGLITEGANPTFRSRVIVIPEPEFTMRPLPRKRPLIPLPASPNEERIESTNEVASVAEQSVKPAADTAAVVEQTTKPTTGVTTVIDETNEPIALVEDQAITTSAEIEPAVEEQIVVVAPVIETAPTEAKTDSLDELDDRHNQYLSEPELVLLIKAIQSIPDWGRLGQDKQQLLILLLSEITASSVKGGQADRNRLNRKIFDLFHDGERAKLREDPNPDVVFMVAVLNELADVRGADKRLRQAIRNVKIR